MPVYNYECSKCEHAEEIFQKMSDEPLVKCPACKKKKFRRVITSLNFAVKQYNTVGAIAEQNSKKLGKMGVEDKDEHRRAKSTILKRQMKPIDPLYDGPLKDAKTRNKVLKSKKSIKNYIYEGKI